MGFAEYRKVIYGLKHILTLTRGWDHQALYHNATVDGKVDITNISWHMPQIQMIPNYLIAMRNISEQKVKLPLGFRAKSAEQTTLTQTHNFTWRLSVTGGVKKNPDGLSLDFKQIE